MLREDSRFVINRTIFEVKDKLRHEAISAKDLDEVTCRDCLILDGP